MQKKHTGSCDRGIATRNYSGGNRPDKLALRSQVEGCRQGDTLRSIYILGGGQAQGTLETFPACMSVPGIPQGQLSYQRALQSTVPPLFASRACDTVEAELI